MTTTKQRKTATKGKVTVRTILLSKDDIAKWFRELNPTKVTSRVNMYKSMAEAGKDTLWISGASEMTKELLKAITWPSKRLGRAVLLHEPTIESMTTLSKVFDRVVYRLVRGFLSIEELAEVLKARNREDLFIGGAVDKGSETVTLWRGNLDSLVVPFSAFPPSGDGTAPDFDDFTVIDYGQTVRFGEYEAAADAILYEYDPKYRRRKMKEQIASDQGLGPAIRRLRLQRGLKRDDFPGIDAKTIARIEQGKVKSIRDKTRNTIAEVLQVDPGELETF
jgi:DNA-binding Xre family transcriptional regulator